VFWTDGSRNNRHYFHFWQVCGADSVIDEQPQSALLAKTLRNLHLRLVRRGFYRECLRQIPGVSGLDICTIRIGHFVRIESVLLHLLHFGRGDETEKNQLVPTYQEFCCCPVCVEDSSAQVSLRSVTIGLLLFDFFRSLRLHSSRRSYCGYILHWRVLPTLRSVLLPHFHHDSSHLAAVAVRASQRDSLATDQSQESTQLQAGC
jgi:hypothetical protein